MDLFLPLQKQMEVSLQLKFPTTWLLQFDALVSGPFVEFLKAHMVEDHEIGIWFEMNEMHCKAAGVDWRGRPGYEWDHYPDVAFTIGYTHDERIKLANAFMEKFKEVCGNYARSVASWNLDAITMAHLTDRYHVDAFAVCRDQIATDGFTIWGAPIAGYYPSKTNCWSPALDRKSQIQTPVFRMLGQNPVYYYQSQYPMPDGEHHGPDTMEPVWPSGRSSMFIELFLSMIAKGPSLGFAYAQLGQENNFGWPEMAEAYPKQMKALADLRDSKAVYVETMGETGRRFNKSFEFTPNQAQVMLEDPFGNTTRVERSIWFQSRFYRADLHSKGELIYLRDLTVYSDRNPQPFLEKQTRPQNVEQRMPAVLDGFHWSKTPGSSESGAGGFFLVGGQRLVLAGDPIVREQGSALWVELPVEDKRVLSVEFEERCLSANLSPNSGLSLTLSFGWDPSRSSFLDIEDRRAKYRWQGFDYSGKMAATEVGWSVSSSTGRLAVFPSQSS